MVDQVKKPWKHPPVRNPSSGEAGQWQEVSGRTIFIPDGELDPQAIGDAELDAWEHPAPAYQAEGEEDENPNQEVEKDPLPNNNQEIDKPQHHGFGIHAEMDVPETDVQKPSGSSEFGFGSELVGTPEPMEYTGKPVVPQGSQPVGERGTARLEHEDPVGMVQQNKDSPTGYGNLDMGFVQGRGENDIDARNSETYIGSAGNRTRKTNMNKITHTKVGDDIHFYVNGKEDRGIVVKMGSSYIQVFKEDGNIADIHINDTFFVKDIIINKVWDNMSDGEKYEALNKIHAPSPRFISKKWEQLPKEIKDLLTKTGFTYESGKTRKEESEDHSRTGMQQTAKEGGEIDPSIETEREKSDVELQQGRDEPLLGGVSTIEEPLDAKEDYEGQTHDDKEEQFKHKESQYDAATGQKKGLAAVGLGKEDSPGFNAIYGQSGGVAGTDEKYGGQKSGKVGVPDYNKNSYGIKYVKTKGGKFWCEQHQSWETEQSHNQPPSGVGT